MKRKTVREHAPDGLIKRCACGKSGKIANEACKWR